MLGKSVRTLDLRKVYGINIIAVEHGQQTNVEFSADYTFKEGGMPSRSSASSGRSISLRKKCNFRQMPGSGWPLL